jgi:hypothetical protein
MDQKHDFVMSHCIPLRILATRLSGVARGCDLAVAPTYVTGGASYRLTRKDASQKLVVFASEAANR